jgi:hypothetical protein
MCSAGRERADRELEWSDETNLTIADYSWLSITTTPKLSTMIHGFESGQYTTLAPGR